MELKVAPSILSADFGNLGEEIRRVVAAGADAVHVDVMDGHFVPNITIGPPVVASSRRYAEVPLDVHLMIEKPEEYVDAFAESGSDTLTIHGEATYQPYRTLEQIRARGMSQDKTIRVDGLNTGDIIAVAGVSFLADGMQVKLMKQE